MTEPQSNVVEFLKAAVWECVARDNGRNLLFISSQQEYEEFVSECAQHCAVTLAKAGLLKEPPQ